MTVTKERFTLNRGSVSRYEEESPPPQARNPARQQKPGGGGGGGGQGYGDYDYLYKNAPVSGWEIHYFYRIELRNDVSERREALDSHQ